MGGRIAEAALRGRPGEGSRRALQDLGAGDDLSENPAHTSLDGTGPLRTCIDAVVGARRLAAWCLWLELLAVARLLAAWESAPPILDERIGPDPCDGADPALATRLRAIVTGDGLFVPTGALVDTALLAPEFVTSEISAAAGTSATAAWARVRAAQALFLNDRLPRTRVLLRAGLLDWTKLTTLLRGTEDLTDEVCRAVEARVVTDADLTLAEAAGQPGHVLDVLDSSAHPDGPGSGLPWLTRVTNPVLGHRLARAVAAVDALTAAHRAENARSKRCVRATPLADGMGRLEIDAAREVITAIAGDLDACVATAKAGGDTRTPDQIRTDELVHRMTLGAFGTSALAGTTMSGASGATSGPAGVRALRVSLTMPLSTWLDLADEPGTLDGYGAIPAALARQIATEAARDHPTTTTWRCVPVDDVHRTVLGVGDTIPTPRHDAAPRLRNLVTTADPVCVWPNCARRASTCDIDHRVPHAHGGPTCSCNIQPLCRKHHRLKGTGLIRATSNGASTTSVGAAPHSTTASTADGTAAGTAASTHTGSSAPRPLGPGASLHPVGSLTWKSWTGRAYTYEPPAAQDVPVDADTARADRALAAAAEHRRRLVEEGTPADPDDVDWRIAPHWQRTVRRFETGRTGPGRPHEFPIRPAEPAEPAEPPF